MSFFSENKTKLFCAFISNGRHFAHLHYLVRTRLFWVFIFIIYCLVLSKPFFCPGLKTIEGELLEAFEKGGYIDPDWLDNPQKAFFQRASRYIILSVSLLLLRTTIFLFKLLSLLKGYQMFFFHRYSVLNLFPYMIKYFCIILFIWLQKLIGTVTVWGLGVI